MARRWPALAIAACLLAAGCGGGDDEDEPFRGGAEAARGDGGAEAARSDGRARVQTIATGLEAPWEIAFLPDGRALITERPGRVRLLGADRRLRPEPLAEVDVEALGEAGLLGLAVDPDFAGNGFVYLYRTTPDGNEVARYRLEGERLEEQAVIAQGIQASAVHDGGRIHFGPDGRLYFTAGDAADDDLAQDPESLNGKMLVMDAEAARGQGGRPEVFSLGHRNPQGFDWRPGTDELVASEHGAEGNDEINLLSEGENYGWPEVVGRDHGDFQAPAVVYEDSIAPSGATFVSRPRSAWSGDLLVAALAGEQIRRLSFGADGAVTRDEGLFEDDFGRLRTVVEGPDGALYALTSNLDGRGAPREGDDRVLRIVPPGA
jgi:glucose/arabinose dehydrogenase